MKHTILMTHLFLGFLFVVCSTFIVSAINVQQTVVVAFSDTQTHWSAPFISYLQDNCGVEGYKDASGTPLGLFKPDNTLIRGELAVILVNCVERTMPDPIPEGNLFADSTGTWFSSAVAKASFRSWVSGFPDGTFRPYHTITRSEALKMILRAYDIPLAATIDLPFSDIPTNHWAEGIILTALDMGIIDHPKTSGKTTFRPDHPITRGEVAKLISLTSALKNLPATVNNEASGDLLSHLIPPPPPLADSSMTDSCEIFPKDNPWNQDISSLEVHQNSDAYIASILSRGKTTLHPDFGSNPDYGIPFNLVSAETKKLPVNIVDYPQESDRGPFPIPENPRIEGGSDKHLLLLDTSACILHELYNVSKTTLGWQASSAATFDLTSNKLRPKYWTSADAAGLPIYPGLVRYDEVKSGKISHALRFTVKKTQRGFISPARHFASSDTDTSLPPMGLRLRLKKDFDLSGYSGDSRVILEALKTYGMIVADNGSDWYISGATDDRWDDEDLRQLKSVPGSAFEAVYTGEIES